MNLRAVLNVLGALLVFLGLSCALPIGFSIYFADDDFLALAQAALLTVGVGGILHFLNRQHSELRIREGFAIVTFGWIISATAGALPFCFYGNLTFTDAYFEIMSGFTTTGASILSNIEALPHGLQFWRCFTQWLGGMGIIVLSVAILPALGVGGMQLFKAEVPGPSHDKLKPRVQETAKTLWGVYVLLSGAETALLLLGGMNLFEALCHTFTTMATGGFSTRNASIGAYGHAYIDGVITFFMILAGTNFALHYSALHGRVSEYWRDSEFRFYLGIIAVFVIVILFDLLLRTGSSFGQALMQSSFQVASIVTTTGFATADFEKWPGLSQLLLMMLMLIGGCAGSTAGSVKAVRILIIFKYAFAELKRLIHPNAVIPVRLNGKTVSQEVIVKVLGFSVLYVVLLAVAAVLLCLMQIDLPTAVTGVMATLGNVGPGFGTVGPTENYGHLPVMAKWLLSFCMLLGRLEIFTVLVIFGRDFWIK
jgi:trk system potassium uptake protein TrkH